MGGRRSGKKRGYRRHEPRGTRAAGGGTPSEYCRITKGLSRLLTTANAEPILMTRKTSRRNFCRRKCKSTYLVTSSNNLTLSTRRAAKSLEKIIQEKGKGFTIFYDMFRDIDVIIEWGATFDEDSESLDDTGGEG